MTSPYVDKRATRGSILVTAASAVPGADVHPSRLHGSSRPSWYVSATGPSASRMSRKRSPLEEGRAVVMRHDPIDPGRSPEASDPRCSGLRARRRTRAGAPPHRCRTNATCGAPSAVARRAALPDRGAFSGHQQHDRARRGLEKAAWLEERRLGYGFVLRGVREDLPGTARSAAAARPALARRGLTADPGTLGEPVPHVRLQRLLS